MRGFALTMALGAALVGISSAQTGAIGCFADDRSDRVLTAKWSSHAMIPTTCAAYCTRESSRYVYYATQWGQECWCQDENIDLRHGEGTCDYACLGDETTVCGGFYSFSLYRLEDAVLPASPTDDSYMGCFADDRRDRVLGAMTSSSEMTSEVCAAYCANESSRNRYYATQYGKECWCAPAMDLGHSEGECNFPCSGAAKTTCGGFDAFDLFELTPVYQSYPPSEDYYIGCFADDQHDRVLEDKTSSVDMTLQMCEDYCMAKDKPFFALQWGQECWCGGCKLLDEGYRYDRHGATSCTGYPCTGETSRDCGAFDAFSLYYGGTCEGSWATGTPTGHPTTGPPTATPTSYLMTSDILTDAPTTAPVTDSQSPFLSWLYEGTEVKMRETAEPGVAMWFEIPDSGGQLAELFYSDERLQQVRVGTEIFRVEYDTNGEILDLVPVDSEGRRTLQSEEQNGDHLPAWLTPNTIEGMTKSRVGCTSCALMMNTVCQTSGLLCGYSSKLSAFLRVASPLTILTFEIACKASDYICHTDTALILFPDIYSFCGDFFCCDRSKCGWFGDCYDEEVEECRDDGSVALRQGCDPGKIACGPGAVEGVRPPICYDPDTQQCCLNDFISPSSECCPGQAECGDECYDPSSSQCCDGTIAQCCNEECGDRCYDSLDEQCCADGNILDKDECCVGYVGYNGDVNCCADGGIAEWDECCPGEDKCQDSCYDPLLNECCEDEDGFFVDTGTGCPRACDDGSIASNGECCPDEVQCIYGSSCYDPEYSSCCEDDSVIDIESACSPVTPPTPAPITPAPQSSEDDVPKRGGSIGGDPHMEVYDGLGYDCHGQGEFVVTKAAATDSEVQARFQQWSLNPNPGVTVTTAVAAREGTSSVIQATSIASGGLEVWVDGELYDEAAGTDVTGVALELLQARVEMRFPSGLDVFVSTITGGVLRVDAYVPLDLATTGLLGNNNGDIGDDWRTADDEIVEFSSAGPTVAEGTSYCTTNWCTTEDFSVFTYGEGEDHGTYDLCDAVYEEPVLPDVIPAAITELCGDSANCIFDALLAGEEVGQATLEEEEAARVYQEGVGGLCASNTFSSTGTPPCTDCPAGDVSGRGATVCIPQGDSAQGVAIPTKAIVAVMLADATGGFAGPGSFTTNMPSTIELTDENLGLVSVSGKFVRDDGMQHPTSASVFFYIDNAAQPDDFSRGEGFFNTINGEFEWIVTDIPAGSSRLFMSFVLLDPAQAEGVAEVVPATSLFAVDIYNMGCVPSLTITHECFGCPYTEFGLTEPGGTFVHTYDQYGDVGLKRNIVYPTSRYVIFSGLDTSQALGEYTVPAAVSSTSNGVWSTWRITARVSGEVVLMEEREPSDQGFWPEVTVILTEYDPSCGEIPQ